MNVAKEQVCERRPERRARGSPATRLARPNLRRLLSEVRVDGEREVVPAKRGRGRGSR